MATMPQQHPGTSEQVVCTPVKLLNAIRQRLGIHDFDIDLAASETNRVTTAFMDETLDALTQPWKQGSGWNWCNPPYAKLEPWVSKAVYESHLGAQTAMLVPSSTGANWWRDWVEMKAYVTFLNGRVTFVGHTKPYPKDLALLLYAPFLEGGSTVWTWGESSNGQD